MQSALSTLARRLSGFACAAFLAACGGGGGGATSPGPQPAVVSIADATLSEGAAGQSTTLSMTNAAGVSCRVTVTTANLSAQASQDYVAIAGATVILAGAASLPLPLSVNDDILVEANETFTVTIALAAGSDPVCQLGRSVATITIVSDDVASVVSIADATITEVSGGGQALVSMTNPAGRTCAVTVTSTNGTATAPADYAALSAAPVTLAGVGSVAVPLSAVNDSAFENSETFTLTLALAAGADPRCQLGTAVATVTITSDEPPPVVISIADATVTEGAASATTTISRSSTDAICRVAVSTSNGTAVAPGDYASVAGALFDVNGVDPLVLSIVDDLNVEPNETFTVTIALVAGADPRCQLGDAVATITILSNDMASVVSIADVTVTEGTLGQTTISRTNPAVFCEVAVSTSNGTATAPADYTAISGSAFLVNGDPLNFNVVDDLLIEAAETFTISIALTVGADPRCQLGDATATVTIVSNDSATVVSIADATVTEGAASATTTISRSNSNAVCRVSITTSNGTAVAPADYASVGGAQFDVNGVDPLSFSIVDDLNIEANETFTVTIALVAGADPRCQLGDASATITIVSNDVPTIVSIADATVTEGGASNFTTISRSNNGAVCTVSVTTSNGTATAPSDYLAYAGATFDVNGVDTLPLSIVNDVTVEGPETFTVTIALVAGADPRCQLGDASATITIVSNE